MFSILKLNENSASVSPTTIEYSLEVSFLRSLTTSLITPASPTADKSGSPRIEEDFKIFTQNQKMRDHDHYHITVINVMDCNRLSKEMGMVDFVKSVELAFEYPVEDLEMLGVGMASKSANTAYFIVCSSDGLDAVRTRFNLTKQDFHITLGFNVKDVFGVPKNVVIN